MPSHANHVFIIGKVLQTWTYSDDRICRLSMKRSSFQPQNKSADLVNVVLPNAVSQGVNVNVGDTLHISGFIYNEDRDVPLSALMGKAKLPDELKDLKVRQIITQIHALNWQIT